MDDHQLVRQAQSGDRAAFAALVRRHYTLMFKLAWQHCGNRSEAEDIAQESAIKLARSLADFRFESLFTTWLYRLVLNTARDQARIRLRRAHNELPMIEDMDYASAEMSPEQALADKDVVKAVRRLPDDLKDTVILCYWQGLSHKETGIALGCSEGTVSWRLHEARRKMGETLGANREGKHYG